MAFGTVICCMDGRIQLPVIFFLKARFGVDFIDNITNAGPVRVISALPDQAAAQSIFRLIDISIDAHGSSSLAIVAHHDCAGNPVPIHEQKQQLRTCLEILANRYPQLQLLGLWLDKDWQVHEISAPI